MTVKKWLLIIASFLILTGITVGIGFPLGNIPYKISTILTAIFLLFGFYAALYVLVSIDDQKKRAIESAIGSRVIEFREINAGWQQIRKYHALTFDGKEYVVIFRGMNVISTSEVKC